MEEEVIKKYHTNFRIKTIPIILIILLIIVLINMSSDKKIPKEEIQLYVIENIYLLNEIALDIIKNESSENYSFKDIQYISYKKIREDVDYIEFNYGARGMLGGQYWGFYYISDNEPGFDFELELTKAEFGWEWNEPNGNNYYYTERITDNWFYWLIDYDH